MGKTIIEVFTDSVNPFCLGLYGCYNCIYCHTVRLMKAFPKNFQPGVYLNRLDEYLNAENKSIFLNSMFDICHPKISDENLTRFFKEYHNKQDELSQVKGMDSSFIEKFNSKCFRKDQILRDMVNPEISEHIFKFVENPIRVKQAILEGI